MKDQSVQKDNHEIQIKHIFYLKNKNGCLTASRLLIVLTLLNFSSHAAVPLGSDIDRSKR